MFLISYYTCNTIRPLSKKEEGRKKKENAEARTGIHARTRTHTKRTKHNKHTHASTARGNYGECRPWKRPYKKGTILIF